MIHHKEISEFEVRLMIRKSLIALAGNMKLKIAGSLRCVSGKRMNRSNRVFFESMTEAVTQNFRPCGHCMKAEYKKWKNEFVQ